jgi:hypothetical protein
MRKIILHFLCFTLSAHCLAQKQVVLENIRCYATNIPIENYLRNDNIAQTIVAQLNHTLLQRLNFSLTDTVTCKVQFLDFNHVVPPIQTDYIESDTARLHLYLDMIEMNPFNFFRIAENYAADSAIAQRARTVFLFKASFYNADKSLYKVEKLSVSVSPAPTQGMGILYGNGIRFNDFAVLPKVFTEFFKIATGILLDPKSDVGLIELQLQPAFFTDNYILPKIVDQPRTFVTINKNISSYHYENNTGMIRMEDPVYEQIMIKGKKAQKYPIDITNAILKTEHFEKSDFVFLRQECRDVMIDKNYLLKYTVQVDPENPPEEESLLLTNFLPGNFHYLLSEKDTIAKFSIRKNVPGTNELYLNSMGNGFDTISAYRIKNNFTKPLLRLGYSYIEDGVIGNRPFSIKCSGLPNSIKEIYLENKLVCIAQGKFTIEKFVLFDASLSLELLNQLFMIGFNHFFE